MLHMATGAVAESLVKQHNALLPAAFNILPQLNSCLALALRVPLRSWDQTRCAAACELVWKMQSVSAALPYV